MKLAITNLGTIVTCEWRHPFAAGDSILVDGEAIIDAFARAPVRRRGLLYAIAVWLCLVPEADPSKLARAPADALVAIEGDDPVIEVSCALIAAAEGRIDKHVFASVVVQDDDNATGMYLTSHLLERDNLPSVARSNLASALVQRLDARPRSEWHFRSVIRAQLDQERSSLGDANVWRNLHLPQDAYPLLLDRR